MNSGEPRRQAWSLCQSFHFPKRQTWNGMQQNSTDFLLEWRSWRKRWTSTRESHSRCSKGLSKLCRKWNEVYQVFLCEEALQILGWRNNHGVLQSKLKEWTLAVSKRNLLIPIWTTFVKGCRKVHSITSSSKRERAEGWGLRSWTKVEHIRNFLRRDKGIILSFCLQAKFRGELKSTSWSPLRKRKQSEKVFWAS